jgi:cytosine/adenosine deaminase-related metal-dependent hydrolase
VLILADWLIAEPGEAPRRDAGVRVVGDRVDAVGFASDLLTAHPGDDVVRRHGAILAPGFVNAHTHLYGVLAHGIPLDHAPSGFWPFLAEFWWPLVEDRLDERMITTSTEWGVAEMLRTGTTTFYDVLEAPHALPGALVAQARVVERLGARAILSFEATQRVSEGNGEAGLAENVAMIEHGRRPGASGMVHGAMCFHTTFTCGPDFVRRAVALAAEHEVFCHAHVNEGTHEGEWCEQHHGVRTIEHYAALGVLSSRFLASQCVQISERERALLAEHGVRCAHMPLSNCEVGGGIAPVPELLDVGVAVALGSDGYLNDAFDVMRAAFLLHKARRCDPAVMPAATVFRMATIGGAECLGLRDVGALRPGWAADLQLIDASVPTPLTASNLYDQLVLWRSGRDVTDVMVAGRWRVRDGVVEGVDTDRLRTRVAEEATRLWASA